MGCILNSINILKEATGLNMYRGHCSLQQLARFRRVFSEQRQNLQDLDEFNLFSFTSLVDIKRV